MKQPFNLYLLWLSHLLHCCRAKAQDDWTKDLPLPSFMKGHGNKHSEPLSIDNMAAADSSKASDQ